MNFVRYLIDRVLLALNFATRPSLGQRSEQEQKEVEQRLKFFSLYQFRACPFCIKVTRCMRRLNLPIVLKDAKNDETVRAELLAQGGSSKVPCLRINDTWMYESSDIIKFLETEFPINN
jgi:glutaredoxin